MTRRKWNNYKQYEEPKAAAVSTTNTSSPKIPHQWKNRSSHNAPWFSVMPSNSRMEAYYALQGLHSLRCKNITTVHPSSSTSKICRQELFIQCQTNKEKEDERQRWMNSLRSILPASFRIGRDVDPMLRKRLEREIEGYVGKEYYTDVVDTSVEDIGKGEQGNTCPELTNKVSDEKCWGIIHNTNNDKVTDQHPISDNTHVKCTAPIKVEIKRIPYIPHAYQLSIDRRTIRRNPTLESFHNWLKSQVGAGFITRQETVSMIPPVVLAPESHHAVLDLCAAPGSKTSQILEIVGCNVGGEVGRRCDSGDRIKRKKTRTIEPEGFVVANDSDMKRAYILVHQLRRLNSPAVFVTSMDAQFWPLLKKKNGNNHHDTSSINHHGAKYYDKEDGIFDRVLCDVPCSGDGTARKNPGVWKKWSSLEAISLHPLQINIAINGARLTKVGGYMCYSTCSMNPIENEAVVSEVLRCTDGSLELVDKRSDLPDLVARPGMTTWKVVVEPRSRRKAVKKSRMNRQSNVNMLQETEKSKHENYGNDGTESKGVEILRNTKQNVDTKNIIQATTKNVVVTDTTSTVENIIDADVNVRNSLSKNVVSVDGKNSNVYDKNTTNDFGEFNNDGAKKEESWVSAPPSWDIDMLEKRARTMGLVPYQTFDDVPKESRRRIRLSCFPPTTEELHRFDLHKCMRCLPQDMDTGGFFVALFKKVAPISEHTGRTTNKLAQVDQASPNGNSSTSIMGQVLMEVNNGLTTVSEVGNKSLFRSTDVKLIDPRKVISSTSLKVPIKMISEDGQHLKEKDRKHGTNHNVSTMKPAAIKNMPGKNVLGNNNFMALNDNILPPLVNFYGLNESFPSNRLMARASNESKILYFITESIKYNLIDCNIQDRVTVIQTGLKAFERGNRDNHVIKYRPCQEGIQYIVPYMTKRKLVVDHDDFLRCLGGPNMIKCESFSQQLATDIRSLSGGAFAVVLRGHEQNIAKKMFLTMWRCRGDNVNCLVKQFEQDGMRTKLKALMSVNDLEL